MIENAMVRRNGYGIRDPQEYEPVLQKDLCGCEMLPDDELLVSPDGEIVLRENAARYLILMLGFREKRGGF
ncbi:YqaI family protein [Bacillus cereus]|uniref:YqaI family protein n=1 Tax=Bacillus cereus TaxID=1396 RepID=UPI003D647E46